MMCFFEPSTLNWRVTTQSLRSGLLEVEESDGMALPSVAAVLFEGDAVRERGVECLVSLGEAGGRDLRHGLDGLADVGLREPRNLAA